MIYILLKWDEVIVDALGMLNNVILIVDDYDHQHFNIDYTLFLNHYHVSNFNSLEDIINCLVFLSNYDNEEVQFINHTEYGHYCYSILKAYFHKDMDIIKTMSVFRNKAFMKERAKLLNIYHADHELTHDCKNIIKSISISKPYVTKPLNGSGSVGIEIHDNQLKNDNSVYQLSKASPEYYLAERYVDGEEYHADALIHHHEVMMISIAKYSTKPMRLRKESIVYSVILKKSSYSLLYDTVEEIIKKYTNQRCIGTSLIHFEFFINSQEQIIFSEIAARMGGGYIHLLTRSAFYPQDLKSNFIKLITNTIRYKIQKYPDGNYFYFAANIRPANRGKILALPEESTISQMHELTALQLPKLEDQPFLTWGFMVAARANEHDEILPKLESIQKTLLNTLNYADIQEEINE